MCWDLLSRLLVVCNFAGVFNLDLLCRHVMGGPRNSLRHMTRLRSSDGILLPFNKLVLLDPLKVVHGGVYLHTDSWPSAVQMPTHFFVTHLSDRSPTW